MRFLIFRNGHRLLPKVFLASLIPVSIYMAMSDSVRAQVSLVSCPPYEIEGTITPAATEIETDGADAAALASVYVHTAGEPLGSRQVFATFTTGSGEPIGEPVVMITDSEGRAAVPVPNGATDVSFVAEGPDNPDCLVPVGTEPSVALEIGASAGAVPENTLFDDEVTSPGGPGLAYTGPVTTGVVATAALVGAVGCGVWMGRGRRARVSG